MDYACPKRKGQRRRFIEFVKELKAETLQAVLAIYVFWSPAYWTGLSKYDKAVLGRKSLLPVRA